jgi:hypothetical protein
MSDFPIRLHVVMARLGDNFLQRAHTTWQGVASQVTHMYSLNTVDYAKGEHDFKMF